MGEDFQMARVQCERLYQENETLRLRANTLQTERDQLQDEIVELKQKYSRPWYQKWTKVVHAFALRSAPRVQWLHIFIRPRRLWWFALSTVALATVLARLRSHGS